jgi:hypothetical protein
MLINIFFYKLSPSLIYSIQHFVEYIKWVMSLLIKHPRTKASETFDAKDLKIKTVVQFSGNVMYFAFCDKWPNGKMTSTIIHRDVYNELKKNGAEELPAVNYMTMKKQNIQKPKPIKQKKAEGEAYQKKYRFTQGNGMSKKYYDFIEKNKVPKMSAEQIQQIRDNNQHVINLKTVTGNGIADKFISVLPFEAHLIDSSNPLRPKKYSFAGPGTKLDDRLNADLTPKDWSKPVNDLDRAAYHHDLAYRSTDEAVRRVADKKLLNAANQFMKKKNLSISDRINGHVVQQAMNMMLSQ